ncbi:MAG: hypothetical protein ACOX52_24800 [Verrucomicrobiota bacterium]
MKRAQQTRLERFGFSFRRGGAHISRTMMLDELTALLAFVGDPAADRSVYAYAIKAENCLGKRSFKTRQLTYGHLVDLYALAPSRLLFRALVHFWERDVAGRPLLALLCAYARDAHLRATAPFIREIPEGAGITRPDLEEFIEARESGRFSKATLRSMAANINSTWTKSGHLLGRVKKVRTRALPTPGSVSYGLLLGYLSGIRGKALFQSEYAKLLDCAFEEAIPLAEAASRKGWIVFKRIGDVMEVQFPNLIKPEEMEWLREQD